MYLFVFFFVFVVEKVSRQICACWGAWGNGVLVNMGEVKYLDIRALGNIGGAAKYNKSSSKFL